MCLCTAAETCYVPPPSAQRGRGVTKGTNLRHHQPQRENVEIEYDLLGLGLRNLFCCQGHVTDMKGFRSPRPAGRASFSSGLNCRHTQHTHTHSITHTHTHNTHTQHTHTHTHTHTTHTQHTHTHTHTHTHCITHTLSLLCSGDFLSRSQKNTLKHIQYLSCLLLLRPLHTHIWRQIICEPLSIARKLVFSILCTTLT